jgi:hypothetical protein
MFRSLSLIVPRGAAALTGLAFAGLVCAGLALTGPAFAQATRSSDARSIEQTFAASLTEVPAAAPSVAGSIYVPVYSSIALQPGRVRADFSVTLSIHNTSQDKPLVLKRVAYFDTSGALVESYLQKPVALKPFGTIEVFIAQNDVRGGTGANFVVDWQAAGQMTEPVVEALMVGGIGAGHYAFISQGRPIRPASAN